MWREFMAANDPEALHQYDPTPHRVGPAKAAERSTRDLMIQVLTQDYAA
jgi:hypothetical protein